MNEIAATYKTQCSVTTCPNAARGGPHLYTGYRAPHPNEGAWTCGGRETIHLLLAVRVSCVMTVIDCTHSIVVVGAHTSAHGITSRFTRIFQSTPMQSHTSTDCSSTSLREFPVPLLAALSLAIFLLALSL